MLHKYKMTSYFYTSHIISFYNFTAIVENGSYCLMENPDQNSTVKVYDYDHNV